MMSSGPIDRAELEELKPREMWIESIEASIVIEGRALLEVFIKAFSQQGVDGAGRSV